MLSCPQNGGFTVYELVYLPSPTNEFHFMGKKKVSSIADPYFVVNEVQPSQKLVSAIIDSTGGMFKVGIALESILFVNELKFVNGEFFFVGFAMNDGTKMEGEILCVADKCMKVANKVVEMGSGEPKQDNTQNHNTSDENQNNG